MVCFIYDFFFILHLICIWTKSIFQAVFNNNFVKLSFFKEHNCCDMIRK